ncbi:MAG: hypothetical protein PHU04_04220 [Candidatus Peribacteraceae bacterium]|nr:hypothetical protein [Candidatus Peribacteraceae bacterium]
MASSNTGSVHSRHNCERESGSAAARERCDEAISHHQTKDVITDKLKNKPKLLHFGLDYLVLLIGIDHQDASSIRLLNSIFSFPHNDTNASELLGFMWGDSGEEVNIHFSIVKNDEIANVFRGEEKVLSIQKIGKKSTMPPSVKERYQYRISFYSAFFGLVRLRQFAYRDYWDLFLCDIESRVVVHSVSRVDLCADLAYVSVKNVAKGVKNRSGKVKKRSLINIDPDTKEPETFYYGEQSHHWKARVYNKIIEIEKKGKERLYPDYIFYDAVTRVEVEMKSRSCRTYGLNLYSCLDIELLFGVFKAHLDNRSATWRIVKNIEGGLRQEGFKSIEPARVRVSHQQLPKQKFFKQTLNKNMQCADRYGISFEELQEELKKAEKRVPSPKKNL